MLSVDDPLFRRAEAILAEMAQLRAAHQQFQVEVLQQVERQQQIEAELDLLLPHPPEGLAVVRGILTQEKVSANFA